MPTTSGLTRPSTSTARRTYRRARAPSTGPSRPRATSTSTGTPMATKAPRHDGSPEAAEHGGEPDHERLERHGDRRHERHPARPGEPRGPAPQAEADRPEPDGRGGEEGGGGKDRRQAGRNHRQQAEGAVERRARRPAPPETDRGAEEVVLTLCHAEPPQVTGDDRQRGRRPGRRRRGRSRPGRPFARVPGVQVLSRSTAARSSPGTVRGVRWPAPAQTTRFAPGSSAASRSATAQGGGGVVVSPDELDRATQPGEDACVVLRQGAHQDVAHDPGGAAVVLRPVALAQGLDPVLADDAESRQASGEPEAERAASAGRREGGATVLRSARGPRSARGGPRPGARPRGRRRSARPRRRCACISSRTAATASAYSGEPQAVGGGGVLPKPGRSRATASRPEARTPSKSRWSRRHPCRARTDGTPVP